MDPAQPVPTEREAGPAPRTLEARIETVLALAWKTADDAPRAVALARRASGLAASGDASPRVRAFAVAARTREAVLANDLEGVVRLGKTALDDLDGPEDAAWQCRLLSAVANAQSQQGHYAKAKPLSERGLRLAREHGLRRAELEFLLILGQLDASTGRTDQALATFLTARALAARAGEGRLKGFALVNLGAIYRVLGAYPEATTSLLAGIERLEPHGEHGHIATAYCTLSTIYALSGRPTEAIAAAQEALDQVRGAPDSFNMSNAFIALGFAHDRAGDYDAALEATRRGMEIRQRLGAATEAAAGSLLLGDIHLNARRLDEADESYREGLDLVAGFDEPRVRLGCEAGLAQVLEARGDYRGALALAEPLIAVWEGIGETESLAASLDLAARLQELNGDTAAALANIKRARSLREEIFNRESDARLQHLQITHEVSRERERTAEALRELSRHVIASQEDERRRVARELHDDLSQRLALLAVELDVLSRTPPASTEEVSSRFDALADSVRVVDDHVHRISHQLHPATLEQLGLVEAARSVCGESALAYDVDIAFAPDELSPKLPQEIELGLYRIIQEALRNAIRHGRAQSISVRLFEDAEGVCVHVRDEGVGFDPDAPEGSGIGLVGMRERAEHLGGHFTVGSAPGQGTFIQVCVPRPPVDV